MKKISKIIQQLLINESETNNFLITLQDYTKRGMDKVSAIDLYIETAEAPEVIVKKLKKILKEINRKGAVHLPKLLLEENILKNKHEATIMEKIQETDLAIEMILDGRTKNSNMIFRYLKFYFLHLVSSILLMSWYLLEDSVFKKTIIWSANLIKIDVITKTTFIEPNYWHPFPVFVVGIFYALFCLYHIIILIMGKNMFTKEFYRIQKHEETNDIVSFLRLLKDKISIGYNFHDSLVEILDSVEHSVKKPLKKTIKILYAGKNKISKTFHEEGFSKKTSKILYILELGDLNNKLEDAITAMEGRRKNIKTKLDSKIFLESAYASIFIVYIIYTLIVSFEVYKAMFSGINVS